MELVLAVALCVLGAVSSGHAQQVIITRSTIRAPLPADKNEAAKTASAFPPEVETKFAEFIKKIAEAKRNIWREQMAKEIKELQQTTGLSDEAAKPLETAAQQAADLCLPVWTAKIDEMMRQGYSAMPAQQVLGFLEAAMAQSALVARDELPGDNMRPSDQAAWIDAVRRALSPEQYAAWEKVREQRQADSDKEIGDYLDAQVDRVRKEYRLTMEAKSGNIARLLNWPPEQAAKLDALGRSAADQAAEAARDSTRKMLLAMSEAQRSQIIRGQGMFMSNDTDQMPEKQAVWKDGLTKLLSAGDQKALEAAQDEVKRKRLRALGQLFLALVDEKIALTAAQRLQLQPLAERLMQDEPSLSPETNSQGYISFSPQTFYDATAKADPKELERVLDPVQCQRWREIKAQSDADANDYTNNFSRRGRPVAAAATTPGPAGEPEDVEQDISDFLYARAERKRQRLEDFMVLQAEDAARVGALPADGSSRLQTAARGAAEESLADWKAAVEQTVRSQLQDVTPENVKARLEGIQQYILQRSSTLPEKTNLWRNAVAAELTEPQRTAWEKEVDARSVYHDTAIVSFITAEFDRQNPLTDEQREKLVPLLVGVLKEYGPDFGRMFAYSNNQVPWYLQGYSMFLPFAGAPEADLKSILGQVQWERWTGSQECSNVANYWGNIQNLHNQNKKLKNQGAALPDFF